MTKFFKNKQKQALTSSEPRAIDAITKDYAEAKNKLADSQYLVYVYGLEVDKVSRQMLSLAQEASARNSLDAETKKEEMKEGSDVQS